VPGGFTQPVPAGYNTHIIQGVHPTAGLPGYPAADFGGIAGAPVIAVENGTIIKLSGEDPAKGPWDPILKTHGPFGWSIYLKGDSGSTYYYTHLGSRNVQLNQRVQAGVEIATIGDYAKWGGANHTHVGVSPNSSGHPDITDLMNAPLAH
jgi:murein DD-endopeptidase MepM/ murein hydrolase activator NlpD